MTRTVSPVTGVYLIHQSALVSSKEQQGTPYTAAIVLHPDCVLLAVYTQLPGHRGCDRRRRNMSQTWTELQRARPVGSRWKPIGRDLVSRENKRGSRHVWYEKLPRCGWWKLPSSQPYDMQQAWNIIYAAHTTPVLSMSELRPPNDEFCL